MTVLNDAPGLYVGNQAALRAYLGSDLVWGDPPVVSAYDAAVLADSPVAYWPLQGPTGVASVDVVHGLPFAYSPATPAFEQPGPHGWDAVSFAGNTRGYTAASDDLPTGASSSSTGFSSEIWFLQTGGTALATLAGCRPLAFTAETSLVLQNTPSAGQARAYRTGAFRTDGAGSLNDGLWHHRVDVYDPAGGGTTRVYVDGVLLESKAGAASTTTTTATYALLAGNYAPGYGNPTQYFTGRLSHLALYGHPLSAARVAAHYAAATT